MNNTFNSSIAFAKEMDTLDPLKSVRNKFYIEEGVIYMDGNSLGLFAKDSEVCYYVY